MAKMKISKKGLNHLIKLEGGVKLKMYNDYGASKGHCTIGVGHLIHKGICNGVHASERIYLKGITLAQAKKHLKNDLKIAEKIINRAIVVPLTQNQFNALVSFVFNVGVSAFRHSTLKRFINKKQYIKASNEFPKWNKMNIGGVKKKSLGLVNSRKAEKALFLKVSP